MLRQARLIRLRLVGSDMCISDRIKKGLVFVYARMLYAGYEIATVNLVAAEDVHMSVILYIGYAIKSVFQSKIFCIVFALVILVLAIYIGLIIRHNREKKRRKHPKTIRHFRNFK